MDQKCDVMLAISLLEDEHGIIEKSFQHLKFFFWEGLETKEILQAVKGQDGRVYLPKDWRDSCGDWTQDYCS